ncbi:MAG: hypothetical protein DWQ06_14005 [Calditrichaeota bacterium]|nr:MAG: hypothetical protein DWQ06_14005 [Calditrichota bacterium]
MQRLILLLILILSVFSFSCEEDEFTIEDEINSIRPIQSISILNFDGTSSPNSFVERTDAYAKEGFLVIEFTDYAIYYELKTAVSILVDSKNRVLHITY